MKGETSFPPFYVNSLFFFSEKLLKARISSTYEITRMNLILFIKLLNSK